MTTFNIFSKNRIVRILGLIQGDVYDALSRAGVNYRLYRELFQTASIVKVIDVEPKGLQRYWLAVRTFYPDKREWARRFYENRLIFEDRTHIAGKRIKAVTEPFDVILQDGAMWLPGRKVSDKPLITYHDSNVVLGSSGGPFAQGSHYRGKKLRQAISLEKEVYDRASRVFAFSDWVRNSMVQDFQLPESKVRVAKPGVNFEIPKDFKKQYDEPVILFIGRNFERKGGPVLLKAFRLVRQTLKKAQLIIVGCSPPIDEDGVTIKGLIPREREDEIKELYRAASVFAMPSRFEPFGLVFLEAMAYKLPCIGTNICAMPEIIGDGECGFVVNPDDHTMLAQKLITLLRDPSLMRTMGNRGFKRVRTDYTWESFANTILGACKEVV
jgi:glycosyltransferase involved in cell wall biosynthesis